MKGREILIGVTGGIAAYKTAGLVSELVQAGAGVTVVLTDAAKEFIGAATFERVPDALCRADCSAIRIFR